MLVPNCTSSCVLQHALTVVLVLVLILVLVLLKPVSLTNVLCEAVRTMNFIISSPLRTHLVNNLYDVIGSTYEALSARCRGVKPSGCLGLEKYFCECFSYKLNWPLFSWSLTFT